MKVTRREGHRPQIVVKLCRPKAPEAEGICTPQRRFHTPSWSSKWGSEGSANGPEDGWAGEEDGAVRSRREWRVSQKRAALQARQGWSLRVS